MTYWADFMRLDDIDRVMKIERVCFPSPWSRGAFVDELTRNDRAVYVVVRDTEGVAVGYGGMWLILDEAHVTNVAVDPGCRRRGIGRLLMESLIRSAVAGGARRMTLEVRVSNYAAQALYRGLGFAPAGTRPGYYQDNHEDALIMWLDSLDSAGDEDVGGRCDGDM